MHHTPKVVRAVVQNLARVVLRELSSRLVIILNVLRQDLNELIPVGSKDYSLAYLRLLLLAKEVEVVLTSNLETVFLSGGVR